MKTIAIGLAIAAGAWAQDLPPLPHIQVMTNTVGGMANNVSFVAGELIGGKTVAGAPYSAQIVTDSVQTLADGNRIVQHGTGSVARDSQGRERRQMPLPSLGANGAGSPPQNVIISDPVAGVNYMLNPEDHTAAKLPSPPAGLPTPQVATAGATGAMVAGVMTKHVEILTGGPGPGAAGAAGAGPVMFYRSSGSAASPDPPATEDLGTQQIQGVSAQGTRTTITIPAGQIGNDQALKIVDERWYSPELQVVVLQKHSDPRMGQNTYSLQAISRAEPSPDLFQVPADYMVRDSPAIQYKIQQKSAQ